MNQHNDHINLGLFAGVINLQQNTIQNMKTVLSLEELQLENQLQLQNFPSVDGLVLQNLNDSPQSHVQFSSSSILDFQILNLNHNEELQNALDQLIQDLQLPVHVLSLHKRKPIKKQNLRCRINRHKFKCVICHQKATGKQTICDLKCKHKFHYKCLSKWTQISASCPLCRVQL